MGSALATLIGTTGTKNKKGVQMDYADLVLKTLADANAKLAQETGRKEYGDYARSINNFRLNRQAVVEAEDITRGL